jgi:hypothetical protein
LNNGHQTGFRISLDLSEQRGSCGGAQCVISRERGGRPEAANCPAIDGLIKEADSITGEIDDKAVLDAAIVANAQAVEHYEIARYGTLIAWAGRTRPRRRRSFPDDEPQRTEGSQHQAQHRGASQGRRQERPWPREPKLRHTVVPARREVGMISISVKGALLWLVGIPLPIILLIALYLHPG